MTLHFFTGLAFELLESQQWKRGALLGAVAPVLVRKELEW